jgi:hypothetical protein
MPHGTVMKEHGINNRKIFGKGKVRIYFTPPSTATNAMITLHSIWRRYIFTSPEVDHQIKY